MSKLIPVSREHRMEPLADVRTEKQKEAFLSIMEWDGFEFFCNNPFTEEVKSYRGEFNALFFKDGHCCVAVINGRGQITTFVYPYGEDMIVSERMNGTTPKYHVAHSEVGVPFPAKSYEVDELPSL